MKTIDDVQTSSLEDVRLGEAVDVASGTRRDEPEPRPELEPASELGVPGVSPLLASAAAFLATAGAGWMLGGVFQSMLARGAGILAALLGAGMFWLSHKTRTPLALQLLILPVALIGGAILVAPDATGGTANLPSLVMEALRSGGLSSPPVPFDPGWRFLLVVLITCVTVTGASAALATGRPHLAVFIPAPVAAAGILVQPAGAELVSVGVALAFVIGGLAVAFGADLAEQGRTGRAFEIRRFARAGAIIGGIVVVLLVVSQVGFLFPEEQESKVIPPKRPEVPPPAVDRVVFRVESPVSMPWRLGVLDVYDENAWLTPPFDPQRFEDLLPRGRVPGARQGVPREEQVRVEFTVTDMEGRVVPNVAAPLAVAGAPEGLQVDPRNDQFRLPGRVRAGTTYTVVAPLPPDAGKLIAAGEPGPELAEFTQAPSPPLEVRDLLAEIPPDVPLYERLQFVRTRFYESVIAAGPGNPVDVPPSRVAEMLAGKEASPYEITAAEVLLARWAGVPARVGYGYYGGEQKDGGILEIRPKHGAMWLEAYFEGSGWVPIVGRPPRAKSSLSQAQKQEDPTIVPTEELGAVVYIPIRLERITLLYLLVQYWVAKALPIVLAGVFIGVFYPGLLKMLRRFRRRVWAGRLGPRERIGAAYANFRDVGIDFNIGHPTMTPIEYLDAMVSDEDHTHLAWLVTRAFWGDLSRDVRSEDAEQAEIWSRTLRRRTAGGQSFVMRILAVASRASLKDPFDAVVPNLWWPFSPRERAVAGVRAAARMLRPSTWLRRLRPASATTGLLMVVLLFGGCIQDVDLTARYQSEPPLPNVPGDLGEFTFEREPNAAEAFEFYDDVSLAAAGELYGIRDAEGTVQGTLQTVVLKPGLAERDLEARAGVLRSVGGGRFKLERIGGERVYRMRLPEQRILLRFSEDGTKYQLLVATQGFDGAEQLFVNLLAYQRGETALSLAESGGAPPLDPRRGP